MWQTLIELERKTLSGKRFLQLQKKEQKKHKFYLEIKILNYDDAVVAAVFRLWKFSQ